MGDLHAVNIRPGVSILSVLPHLNYKPWHALAEFVDNAVQSHADNRSALGKVEGNDYRLHVDIVFDSGNNRITVKDNAAGIDSIAYPRAFRPADIPPDASGLSEFGMGMKSAACWFAPTWTVRTSALGEEVERTIIFDISQIVQDSLEELNVVAQKSTKDAHYTELTLENVKQFPRGKTVGKIKDHLQGIYRRFIDRQGVVIRINGEALAYTQPRVLVAPRWNAQDDSAIEWRKNVAFTLDNGRAVQGWVALRETGSTKHAGLALFRRNRLIVGSGDEPYRPREIFGSSNSFESQRVFGELDLKHFEISHTKDAISWHGAEDEFITKLKAQLDEEPVPLLQQADKFRAKKDAVRKRDAARVALEETTKALVAVDEWDFEGSEESEGAYEILPATDQAVSETVDRSRTVTVRSGGAEWQVAVTVRYAEEAEQWYDIHRFAEDPGENPRRLEVIVNLGHPFLNRFAVNQEGIEGFIRLSVALAIAEARARDGGFRAAGQMRRYVNSIVTQILAQAA